MASNPMQRKARNSFLLGVLITLMLAGIVIALLIIQLKNYKEKEAIEQANSVKVWVLGEDVISGQIITTDMLMQQVINKTLVPNNAIGDMSILEDYALSDKEGNAVAWASAGALGFKGSKKSTPFAAGLSSESAGKKAYDAGMRKVEVYVKGLGPGRETAIRSLQTAGLEITSISDVTPIPHNGCRPPKRPRG